MARPTKNNPKWAQKSPKSGDEKVIKKLEEAFSLDCPIREACFYAEISVPIYYKILEKNPKLIERFEILREKPTYYARKCVIDNAKIDPEIALKYLERKRKSEFSPKIEQELSGNFTLTSALTSPQKIEQKREFLE